MRDFREIYSSLYISNIKYIYRGLFHFARYKRERKSQEKSKRKFIMNKVFRSKIFRPYMRWEPSGQNIVGADLPIKQKDM